MCIRDREHTGGVYLQLQIVTEHIDTRRLHIPPVSQQIQDEKMNQSLVLERFGNAVAVLPTIVALDGKQLQEAGRHIIGDGKLFGQLFGGAVEK